MKKITLFFVSILFMSLSLYAQTPEKFNYQGIARNNSGEPMDNQNLGLQISILTGNATVYTETHNVITNAFGLYTLAIGEGTPVSGTMNSVDWSTGNKFIKVGIDPNGGTNYSDLGTTELLSVPYAMYAASSGGNSGGSNPTGAAGGDLTGTYPNPTIGNYKVGTPKLANNAVETAKISNGAVTALKLNDMGAANGQVLKYDGTSWAPGNDNQGSSGTNYTAGDGIGISGINEITADLGTDIETSELQDGAVTSPKIDAMGATNGQFLKFNGTNWVPANVTGGGTSDNWGSQVTEITDRLSGDGTSGNPLDIAQQGASNGQVLKWNGSFWKPADDETTTSGSGDDWGSQTVEADATLEGEGTTADPLGIADDAITTDKLADGAVSNEKINDMGATNGQVLQYNGTIWEPANISGGGTGDNWGSQTAETDATFNGDGTTATPLGLADAAVTGEKIDQMSASNGQVLKWNNTNNTWEPADDETATSGSGDDWGTQIAETDATLDGDGTTATPLGIADGAVTSEKINDMSATNGQVLKFDGSNWLPGTDDGGSAGTTYTAGDGIGISGTNEITADLGTDIETSELQDGAVIGQKINQMSATNGQILKWNGTTWEPADDETATSGSGDDWGAQTVEADATLEGEGTTVAPLGIADDAIATVKLQDAAVKTNKIDDAAVTGEKIDQMSAADGQVLKWNGTTWEPADDEAGTGGGSGDDWGTQVTETDITLDGDGTTGNLLGIADNAITANKLASGAVTSEKLNQMGATNDQVLTWNGTNWLPEDATAGTGDDWGAQVAETNVTLTGDGTTGNELGLAQNGATDGQIMTWDDTNSIWTPTDQTTSGTGFFEADATQITYGDTGDFGKDLLVNTEQVNRGSGSDPEYKMMFLASKEGAFRAGRVLSNDWNQNNIGLASTAFGTKTEASGDYSVAFGISTEASGYNSTVLGYATEATGDYSTAMGRNAKAPSYAETAIGSYNTDYTPASTDSFDDADRQFTVGIGEDNSNPADGFMVMKSGLVTAPELTNALIDSDQQALVTKQYLDDNGGASFLEADATQITYGDTGDFGKDLLVNTDAVNYTNTAGDPEYKMMFLPSRDGAFRAGEINNIRWDLEYIGLKSVAFGGNTNASGDYSTAMGDGTSASGISSTTMGSTTKAIGFATTAMGFYSEASGNISTAMGYETKAEGDQSTAMGDHTTASGEGATAMGYQTEASEFGSTAMGSETIASDVYSTAMGEQTAASGQSSTAMGSNTTASGSYSTAMGGFTEASGQSSTAMGFDTEASGSGSIAMGDATIASGIYSTAMGAFTEASGQNSTAMGYFSKASGNYSTVIGSNVKVTKEGAMYLADHSRYGQTSVDLRTTANRFYARFENGYYLYTDPTSSYIGVKMDGGANSWSTISDRNKKENVKIATGNYFIESIKKMKIGSWNYIGQDPKEYRHWGPMAQDMYKYFGKDGIGTIGNDTTIATADIDGVMMISIQQLARENDSLKKKNKKLLKEMASLKQEMTAQNQVLKAKIDNYAEEKQVLEAKVENFSKAKGEMDERMSKMEAFMRRTKPVEYTNR